MFFDLKKIMVLPQKHSETPYSQGINSKKIRFSTPI